MDNEIINRFFDINKQLDKRLAELSAEIASIKKVATVDSISKDLYLEKIVKLESERKEEHDFLMREIKFLNLEIDRLKKRYEK